MADDRKSNAERSLGIVSLFESEVLVWLLLRNWRHPLAENDAFRSELLETATEVLHAAATDPHTVFIMSLPASDMNLIAAIWYAEHRALEEPGTEESSDREARLRWLEDIRRALPSCFCPQNDLA